MLATYPQFSQQTLMPSPYGSSGFEAGLGGFGQPGQQFGFAQGHLPFQGQGQGPYALAQQLVVALGQLAHQISIQSVVSQQIGTALQHLTQQIQGQTPGMPGFGLGQPYGQQAYGQQAYGQQPFGGFSPQGQPAWQAWGGQRTQTIQ